MKVIGTPPLQAMIYYICIAITGPIMGVLVGGRVLDKLVKIFVF